MTDTSVAREIKGAATHGDVPISKMRVSSLAQRELNKARVNRIAADLDLDQLGLVTVNLRDGHYFIIDGQHRVEALKVHGYGDQQIPCRIYRGLSEEEEAEKFLKLNDVLTVDAFAKFKVGLHAARADEVAINQVVQASDLCISKDEVPGAVRAVGTLRKVYGRSGPDVLGRVLRIIRDAYGDRGFQARVIDGIGHVCNRYNGDIDDLIMVTKLGNAHGGVTGLLGKAEHIHRSTGNPKAHCVAAAAVEIYNSGRSGKKVQSWWKAAP